jgi:hypothetical protein
LAAPIHSPHMLPSTLSRQCVPKSNFPNRPTISFEIASTQTLLILPCNFCRYLFLFGILELTF